MLTYFSFLSISYVQKRVEFTVLIQNERYFFFPLIVLSFMYGCSVGCIYSYLICIGGGRYYLFSVIHPPLYLAIIPSGQSVLSFLPLWLWALPWACSDQRGVDGSNSSQFWAGILRSTLNLAGPLSSVPLHKKPQKVLASTSWEPNRTELCPAALLTWEPASKKYMLIMTAHWNLGVLSTAFPFPFPIHSLTLFSSFLPSYPFIIKQPLAG